MTTITTNIKGIRDIMRKDTGVDGDAQRISQIMTEAGFKSPILEDIRAEIWLKLWGNMTFNPISSLTHGTLEGICQYPLTKELGV